MLGVAGSLSILLPEPPASSYSSMLASRGEGRQKLGGRPVGWPGQQPPLEIELHPAVPARRHIQRSWSPSVILTSKAVI